MIRPNFALLFTVVPSKLPTYRYMYSLLKRVKQLQGCFFNPLAVIHFLLLFIAEFILSVFKIRHQIGTSPLFAFGIINENLIIRSEFGWLLIVRSIPNVI